MITPNHSYQRKLDAQSGWGSGHVFFPFVAVVLEVFFLMLSFNPVMAYEADEPPPVPAVAASPEGVGTMTVDRSQMIYIKEFRILGSHLLTRTEIEKAVYPYMGPERTPEDVEQARAALEKTIQDKGYQTVSVEIPQQTGKRGIVLLFSR